MDAESAGAIDFALAAYREDGVWQVEPSAAGGHRAPDPAACPGPAPSESARWEWSASTRTSSSSSGSPAASPPAAVRRRRRYRVAVGRSVVDRLEPPPPDDDDDQVQPAGDLGILADLGLSAMELGSRCDDPDLYPDELLGDIAARLGFGRDSTSRSTRCTSR